MKFKLISAVMLIVIVGLVMNLDFGWETLYLDDHNHDELFGYDTDQVGINVVYNGLSKSYRIELKEKDGSVTKLRFVEKIALKQASHFEVESLMKFYDERMSSDAYDHDIVEFEMEVEAYKLILTMEINLEKLDVEKHGDLIHSMKLNDSLEGNAVIYSMYRDELIEMGFSDKR